MIYINNNNHILRESRKNIVFIKQEQNAVKKKNQNQERAIIN